MMVYANVITSFPLAGTHCLLKGFHLEKTFGREVFRNCAA